MNMKIVLVDDDEKIAQLCSQSLKSKGYIVEVFSNPLEAKDFILTHQDYKILISDNIMPRLNGHDLISQCISERDDLYCILATGDDTYNFIHLQEFENVKIVSKPYKRKDIINTINSFFGNESTTND